MDKRLNYVLSSHTDYPGDAIADLEFLYAQVESLQAELAAMVARGQELRKKSSL